MRLSSYRLFIVVASAALVLFGLFYPWRRGETYYRAVKPSNGRYEILLLSKDDNKISVYKIQDGKLFLKVQTMYYAPIMVRGVVTLEWNKAKIEDVLLSHPEIARAELWPSMEKSNGGVEWLKF
jgi:hypothetical protein